MNAVNEVKNIALLAHEGQYRRDGVTPYSKHLEDVARRVSGDPDAEMVAWLHDILEDTKETDESLAAKGVPMHVRTAVYWLTKPEGFEYMRYLQHLKDHPLAKKVKIADMLSNLSDDPTDKQIKKYCKGLLFLLGESDIPEVDFSDLFAHELHRLKGRLSYIIYDSVTANDGKIIDELLTHMEARKAIDTLLYYFPANNPLAETCDHKKT